MFPHLQICIIDSLNKRIRFLEHLSQKLNLVGIQCIHSRAEDAARHTHLRDQFELVTARAVAKLNVLNELCLPFVKKNGVFIAMKGVDPQIEIEAARNSMHSLNAKLLNVFAFKLPIDDSNRHLVMMKKTGITPKKFPRKAGTPLKSPIV